MSNRPILVDIKGLPWEKLPEVFTALVAEAKLHLGTKGGSFEFYEITQNMEEIAHDLGVDAVTVTDVVTKKNYEKALQLGEYRYFGFDEDNDLLFAARVDSFHPTEAGSLVVPYIQTWKEYLVTSSMPTLANQMLGLIHKGIDGELVINLIEKSATSLPTTCEEVMGFVFPQDGSSIYIDQNGVEGFLSYKFSLEPIITHPHYRLYPSGMIVYKTNATTGVIVKVAGKDSRCVGDILTPLQPDEGLIVSLDNVHKEYS